MLRIGMQRRKHDLSAGDDWVTMLDVAARNGWFRRGYPLAPS